MPTVCSLHVACKQPTDRDGLLGLPLLCLSALRLTAGVVVHASLGKHGVVLNL